VVNGNAYYCKVASSIGEEPSVSSTKWSLFVMQGATGPEGPQGIQGIQGIQGVQGVPGESAGSVVKTTGAVQSSHPAVLLPYDYNDVYGNQYVKLPPLSTVPIGHEVVVRNMDADSKAVYSEDGDWMVGLLNNSGTNQCPLPLHQTFRFTKIGNVWKPEAILPGKPTVNGKLIFYDNDIKLSVVNATVSPLSATQLNAAYPVTAYEYSSYQ